MVRQVEECYIQVQAATQFSAYTPYAAKAGTENIKLYCLTIQIKAVSKLRFHVNLYYVKDVLPFTLILFNICTIVNIIHKSYS